MISVTYQVWLDPTRRIVFKELRSDTHYVLVNKAAEMFFINLRSIGDFIRVDG